MSGPTLTSLLRSRGAFTWGLRSGLAITEQVSVAAANFLLNIALARSSAPGDYGAFSLAQAIFIAGAVLYTGFFTEPMMVFVHRNFSGQRRHYYTSLLKIQIVFVLVFAALFFSAGLVLRGHDHKNLGDAILGFAFSGPSLLVFGFLRRVCYCETRPRRAAIAAGGYLLLNIAALVLLVRTNQLGNLNILIATTVCTVPALLYLARDITQTPRADDGVELQSYRAILLQHWIYARWSLMSGAASWVPANIGALVLPAWGGLVQLGVLRALINFVQPQWHVLVAVGGLAMPALSKRHDDPDFWRYAQLLIGGFFLFGVAYAVLLFCSGRFLEQLVYGGRFAGHEVTILCLALSTIPLPLVNACNAVFRAKADPRWILFGTYAGASAAILIGFALAPSLGATGAALAMTGGYLVNATVLGLGLRRLRDKETLSAFSTTIDT